MNKTLQKNQNQANFKKNHSPHPTNKKSADFIPSIRIKSAPYFQIHFTDPFHRPSRPMTDPADTTGISEI